MVMIFSSARGNISAWVDENNRILSFVMLVMNCILMVAIFMFNKSKMMDLQDGTKLQKAFSGTGVYYIFTGCTISLTQSVTLLLDLVLDYLLAWKVAFDDRWERIVTLSLLSVPSALILHLRNDPHLAVFFCLAHAIQIYGCVVTVAGICIQAFPSHFDATRIMPVIITWSVACTSSIVGFGRDTFFWANLITYPTALLSIFLQYRAVRFWVVGTKLSDKRVTDFTVREIYCVCYIGAAGIVVGMVIIVGGLSFGNWIAFGIYDCLGCVYTFCLFSLVVAAIPGRTARFVAFDENKTATWKKTMIRFLSHEIRSPLNVINSTLQSVMDDLSRTGSVDKSVRDDIGDVRQSCTAAVSLLDSILQLEQVESGSFLVNLEFSPCSTLFTLARRCGIIAKAKGIQLTVINSLDDEGHQSQKSRGIGTSRNTYLLLDMLKMEQVLRNLAVNAVKFTPTGGSITINVRRAIASELTDLPPPPDSAELASFLGPRLDVLPVNSSPRPCLGSMSADYDEEAPNGTKSSTVISPLLSRYKSINCPGNGRFNTGIVIEVVDNGVGLSKEHQEAVFGQFVQFRPEELQAGGGSGLGLWICRTIVELHGGTITCHSDGIGTGCIFRVLLRSFVLGDQLTYGENIYDLVSPLPAVGTHSGGNADASQRSLAQQFMLPLTPTPAVPMDLFPLNRFTSASTDSEVGSCVSICDRYLVVDDSELNRKVVCRSLTKTVSAINADLGRGPVHYAIEVDQCEDGTDAVVAVEAAIAQGSPYAVVIMDNEMRNLNGPEASTRMRNAGFKGTIVGLSGYVMLSDVNHFLECGANVVLKKPIDIEDLRNLIVSHIRRRM